MEHVFRCIVGIQFFIITNTDVNLKDVRVQIEGGRVVLLCGVPGSGDVY